MKKFILVGMILALTNLASAFPIADDVLGVDVESPLNWNVATVYSVKYAEVSLASGLYILQVRTPRIWVIPDIVWNENLMLGASQKRTLLGLATSVPLTSFDSTGIISDLLPALKKFDGGVYGGWGYSVTTLDNPASIEIKWAGFDFGFGLIKRW